MMHLILVIVVKNNAYGQQSEGYRAEVFAKATVRQIFPLVLWLP